MIDLLPVWAWWVGVSLFWVGAALDNMSTVVATWLGFREKREIKLLWLIPYTKKFTVDAEGFFIWWRAALVDLALFGGATAAFFLSSSWLHYLGFVMLAIVGPMRAGVALGWNLQKVRKEIHAVRQAAETKEGS